MTASSRSEPSTASGTSTRTGLDAPTCVLAFHRRPGRRAQPWACSDSDGRQIALGTASNSGQIWTMDADGSHQRQLFHDPGYNDDNPRYLPNGDLAFVRCSLSIEGCAIATVHNDGTGVRMLTPMRDGVIDYWMDTSSTGRIAFTRFLAGGVFAQLYVITPGQRPVPVTPAWLGTYKPGSVARRRAHSVQRLLRRQHQSVQHRGRRHRAAEAHPRALPVPRRHPGLFADRYLGSYSPAPSGIRTSAVATCG